MVKLPATDIDQQILEQLRQQKDTFDRLENMFNEQFDRLEDRFNAVDRQIASIKSVTSSINNSHRITTQADTTILPIRPLKQETSSKTVKPSIPTSQKGPTIS